MNKLTAIPKRLLPHSGTFRVPSEADSLGEKSFTSVPILFIRAELYQSTKGERLGAECGGKNLFYYDCENSAPKGLCPEIGWRLIFEGKEYEIVAVRSAVGARRVCHFRMEGRLI